MFTPTIALTNTQDMFTPTIALTNTRAARYWKHVIYSHIHGIERKSMSPSNGKSQASTSSDSSFSIRALSAATGIKQIDVVNTLQSLGMVKCVVRPAHPRHLTCTRVWLCALPARGT